MNPGDPPAASFIEWAAFTHSGRRKPRNDDSWLVFASSATGAEMLAANDRRSLAREDLVFAVSDGMGGGNAGDVASRALLERMSAIIPETFRAAASGIYPDYTEHLGNAIRTVHQHINATAATNPAYAGMAATLALAWFTPENVYFANVGDSRLYRHHHGRLEQLSRDHSFAWCQWRRGQLSEVQFRSHSRRNTLYEIVGGGSQQVSPFLASSPYAADDVFLLCTDGLTDGLWERHIAEMLAAAPPAAAAGQAMLERALANAGLDDTTLIVIAVRRPQEPVPES